MSCRPFGHLYTGRRQQTISEITKGCFPRLLFEFWTKQNEMSAAHRRRPPARMGSHGLPHAHLLHMATSYPPACARPVGHSGGRTRACVTEHGTRISETGRGPGRPRGAGARAAAVRVCRQRTCPESDGTDARNKARGHMSLLS